MFPSPIRNRLFTTFWMMSLTWGWIRSLQFQSRQLIHPRTYQELVERRFQERRPFRRGITLLKLMERYSLKFSIIVERITFAQRAAFRTGSYSWPRRVSTGYRISSKCSIIILLITLRWRGIVAPVQSPGSLSQVKMSTNQFRAIFFEKAQYLPIQILTRIQMILRRRPSAFYKVPQQNFSLSPEMNPLRHSSALDRSCLSLSPNVNIKSSMKVGRWLTKSIPGISSMVLIQSMRNSLTWVLCYLRWVLTSPMKCSNSKAFTESARFSLSVDLRALLRSQIALDTSSSVSPIFEMSWLNMMLNALRLASSRCLQTQYSALTALYLTLGSESLKHSRIGLISIIMFLDAKSMDSLSPMAMAVKAYSPAFFLFSTVPLMYLLLKQDMRFQMQCMSQCCTFLETSCQSSVAAASRFQRLRSIRWFRRLGGRTGYYDSFIILLSLVVMQQEKDMRENKVQQKKSLSLR